MRVLLLTAVLGLSACAPNLVGSNERGGMVNFLGSTRSAAFEVAETHCKRFGRSAVLIGLGTHPAELIFHCV